MKNLLKNNYFKNSIWLYILNFFQIVIPLLTFPFITRVLGSEEYGYFNIALNLVSYMQILIEYGFNYTGTRIIAMSKKEEYQKIYSSIVACKFFLLVVCIGIIALITAFTNYDRKVIMGLHIMLVMLIGIAMQQTWFFQGIQEMKFISIINIVARTISVAFVFLLIKSPENLYLYCLLYSLTYLISGLFSVLICRFKFSLKLRFESIKEIIKAFKNGFSIFLTTAMTKVISSFGALLIGIYVSGSEVGIYYAIQKIPSVLILMFNPISQVMFPYFSNRFKENSRDATKKLRKIMFIVMPIIICLAILIILVSKPLISILCGEEYIKGVIYLYALIPWTVFSILNNFLGVQNLVARGREKEYSKLFSIYCIVSIVANLYFVINFACIGASLCLLVTEVMFSLILIVYDKFRIRNE